MGDEDHFEVPRCLDDEIVAFTEVGGHNERQIEGSLLQFLKQCRSIRGLDHDLNLRMRLPKALENRWQHVGTRTCSYTNHPAFKALPPVKRRQCKIIVSPLFLDMGKQTCSCL